MRIFQVKCFSLLVSGHFLQLIPKIHFEVCQFQGQDQIETSQQQYLVHAGVSSLCPKIWHFYIQRCEEPNYVLNLVIWNTHNKCVIHRHHLHNIELIAPSLSHFSWSHFSSIQQEHTKRIRTLKRDQFCAYVCMRCNTPVEIRQFFVWMGCEWVHIFLTSNHAIFLFISLNNFFIVDTNIYCYNIFLKKMTEIER